MRLEETIRKIQPLDAKVMEQARVRWDSIAKPLNSLGMLEDVVTQMTWISTERFWWRCVRTMES